MEAHKIKFNTVVREIASLHYEILLDSSGELEDGLAPFKFMMNHIKCLTIHPDHKDIYVYDTGDEWGKIYTRDLKLLYYDIDDCLNYINGEDQWQLELNTNTHY